jgi:hypothetical protein
LLVQLAKQLNPDIFVVARASRDSSKKTLEEAGAHIDNFILPFCTTPDAIGAEDAKLASDLAKAVTQ